MEAGKMCQVTAVVLFILGVVASIIIAIGGESFLIFLYVLAIDFVSCLLLYSIGEIIEQLYIANTNIYAIHNVVYSFIQQKKEKQDK